MTEVTPLDLFHAAMEAAPGDDAARFAFYELFGKSELFVLMTGDGEAAEAVRFALSDGAFIMVFDREDRLAGFAEAPSPYAAVPGTALFRMLAGTGVGLALNLGVAPSAFLMPPDAVEWAAASLAP